LENVTALGINAESHPIIGLQIVCLCILYW